MMNNNLDQVAEAIRKAKHIIVCGHAMPDGDSIGSTLAMGLFLKSMDKKVTMLTPDPIPQIYGFLPLVQEIKPPEEFPDDADTAVILDCTDLNRVGAYLADRLKKVPVLINIDHHISNQVYGTYNYIDATAAATGEQVYRLINVFDKPVNQDLATCLYVALVMDTGSFRYENTTDKTHMICAELLKTGINAAYINTCLFENKDVTGLLLLGRALSRLKVSDCGRVAWISIPLQLAQELGAKDEHAEGIVNYPRQVRGTVVGLLFREIAPNRVKVGFRSKETVDVNKLAAFFGGGGHPKAAGCQIEMPLQEAEEKVLAAVLAHIGNSHC
ncbi:DHH family phosphoesterase [Thermincola ferriacetica]|nr:bifunctional oligoribonuclease/PAP phosphatase NrnA [Thermincola ferriacetica]